MLPKSPSRAIISSAIGPMAHWGGARGVMFPLYLNPFAPGPGNADKLLVDGNGARLATVANDRDAGSPARDQLLGDHLLLTLRRSLRPLQIGRRLDNSAAHASCALAWLDQERKAQIIEGGGEAASL